MTGLLPIGNTTMPINTAWHRYSPSRNKRPRGIRWQCRFRPLTVLNRRRRARVCSIQKGEFDAACDGNILRRNRRGYGSRR